MPYRCRRTFPSADGGERGDLSLWTLIGSFLACATDDLRSVVAASSPQAVAISAKLVQPSTHIIVNGPWC